MAGEPAQEVVAHGEEQRRPDREDDPVVAEVGRPHPLAGEGDPAGHDQRRAADQREAERLVEHRERDRDRDERRDAHHDRGPGRPRLANRSA